MKKLLAVLVAITLALTTSSISYAEPYSAPSDAVPAGSARFNIDEAGQWDSTSRLWIVSDRNGSLMPDEYYCEKFGTGPCNLDDPKYNMADSILIAPKCITVTQTNCVDAVSVFKDGDAATEASFIRHIAGPRIEPDPARNLTEGSTMSLWDAPVAPHQGGATTYAAHVAFRVIYDRKTHKFSIAGISASVLPYSEVKGQYQPSKIFSNVTPTGRNQISFGGATPGCAWTDTGVCGKIQDFTDGTRASIKLRVSRTVGGWFSGRMTAADIQIKSLSATSNQIEISAKPVIVPRFSVVVKQATLSDAAKAFFAKNKTEIDMFNQNGFGAGQGTRSDFPLAFEYLDAFREAGNDTASGQSSVWNFQNSTRGSGSACLADNSRVAGLVTTNSTVYQAQAPDFTGGYLNYRVGGMHFLQDGTTVSQGSYDFIMRSEVARCLYKFSNAPLSATVSVINDGGAKTTATTVVSEKNGWLKMAAYGFTFSKKTIKVKITKKKK